MAIPRGLPASLSNSSRSQSSLRLQLSSSSSSSSLRLQSSSSSRLFRYSSNHHYHQQWLLWEIHHHNCSKPVNHHPPHWPPTFLSHCRRPGCRSSWCWWWCWWSSSRSSSPPSRQWSLSSKLEDGIHEEVGSYNHLLLNFEKQGDHLKLILDPPFWLCRTTPSDVAWVISSSS